MLAIDLGSSSFRAAVADASGRMIATARKAPLKRTPADAGELALEYDPDEAWAVVVEVAKGALAKSAAKPSDIAATAVTSQRQGTVLLDGDLNVLYAGPNNDMRGVFAGAALEEAHGDLIWRTCGHLPAYLLAWARLKWFAEERPLVIAQARHVATLADWVVLRLTGELTMHDTSGVEAGLLDVATGEPAAAVAEACGLGGIAMPPVAGSSEAAGTLTREAAEALGLRPGMPVVNAGADTQAGLVGLGAVESGAAGIVAGWSCAVQRVTDAPVFDPDRGLWTGRHSIPGRWVLESNAGIMGGAYAWLAGLIGGDGASGDMFELLDRQAGDAPVGAGNVTAHLGPDSLGEGMRGLAAGGLLFPVPLALSPPVPGEVARAALESFAFAIRESVERIETVAGGESQSLAVGGGMTRSSTFTTVLAAVLGREITAGAADATLTGAAMMAGRAICGGSGTGIAHGEPVQPDRSLVSEYADLYEQWRERSRMLGEMPV